MYAAKRSGRLQVRCFAGAGQDTALLAQGHNAEPHGV
jgi:hypothetical protein